MTDAEGFFGSRQASATPAIDPADPTQSWRQKTIAAWSEQESVEAARTLAFETGLFGRRLSEMGFPARFDESPMRSAGRSLTTCATGARSPPPRALAAPIDITPATEPEPPAEPSPYEDDMRRRGLSADEAEDALERRRIAREAARVVDDLRPTNDRGPSVAAWLVSPIPKTL